MKKILLISELFYPNNCIGALRPSKMCKMLIENEYVVDVVTAYPAGELYISEKCQVLSVYDNLPNVSISNEKRKIRQIRNGFINQFRFLKRTLLAYRVGKSYTSKVMSLFKKGVLHTDDYDACITTFGPISSILIGMKLKQKYHIKNWICDFRDPIAVKMSSVFMYPFYKHIQNKACRYADKIIAVSNGYLRRICGNKYKEKAYMIPNGYDTTDAMETRIQKKNEKLAFIYVGTLYEGKRDISPIFRALSELCSEGYIDLSKVEFAYAGGDYASLVRQAERYGMQGILRNRGRLSREDCLAMQYEANLLVLSTWNERGEEGVFPGKFLEYMLIGRPIISITSGEIPDGEVTSVMREGNFGIAYESARDTQDYTALKAYIRDSYDAFTEDGEIPFSPVQEVLNRYNYTSIMERIEGLL